MYVLRCNSVAGDSKTAESELGESKDGDDGDVTMTLQASPSLPLQPQPKLPEDLYPLFKRFMVRLVVVRLKVSLVGVWDEGDDVCL